MARTKYMNYPSKDDPSKNDLELLHSGNFADGIVKCQGRTWKVHRALLSSRLKFFKAAFAGSFAEATSREIDFPEATPDSVDIMIRHLYREGRVIPTHCKHIDKLTKYQELDVDTLNTPLLCVQIWKLGDYLQLESLKKVANKALEDHLDAMVLLASSDQDLHKVKPVWLRHFLDAFREVCADRATKSFRSTFVAFLWITRFKMLIPETLEILNKHVDLNNQFLHLVVWNRMEKKPHIWFPNPVHINDIEREIQNEKAVTFANDQACTECRDTKSTKGCQRPRFYNPFPIKNFRSHPKKPIGSVMWCKKCADKINQRRVWPWRTGCYGRYLEHKVKAWSWNGDE